MESKLLEWFDKQRKENNSNQGWQIKRQPMIIFNDIYQNITNIDVFQASVGWLSGWLSHRKFTTWMKQAFIWTVHQNLAMQLRVRNELKYLHMAVSLPECLHASRQMLMINYKTSATFNEDIEVDYLEKVFAQYENSILFLDSA
ncbi:hypothetical protein BpHYR1_042138 [Brachionus plicatilis]|uniref:HTH CENPB-type domain-containing protein n=1 Tax=Brachionus plicatilis TaxID=10195 RepID=A0A3M7R3B3_BRAPC|nr:hypothetical protein BpHYR1_042138 [Brachionus plicatilis]